MNTDHDLPYDVLNVIINASIYMHAIRYRVHLYLHKLLQPSKHFLLPASDVYIHMQWYIWLVATVNFSGGSRDFIGGRCTIRYT